MTVKPNLTVAGIVLFGGPLRLAAEASFCQTWSFSKGDAGTFAENPRNQLREMIYQHCGPLCGRQRHAVYGRFA
jgi:hypothetical protein